MAAARTALIIGAGIAGPVAAMALAKAGIEATVFEEHPGTAAGTGSFLTIAPNGIDALRAIGAEESGLATGFPTPSIDLRGPTGKPLGVTRTGLALPDRNTSRTCKRADLYQALYEEAVRRGITIEHGKRLTAVRQDREGVRAEFADGSAASAEVLIGADGIRSATRVLIDPDAPAPRYTGLINLGGYARGIDTGAKPGSYTMIFGRRAFFGYVPAPSGEVWWFANVPRASEPVRGETEAVSRAQWQRTLAGLYAGDAGPAARLVQATDPGDMSTATPIHYIRRLPAWCDRRMIVIGDAAHAPTPTSGQGASLSMEDGVMLAQCLRDLPDAERAFARFETIRRPRVENITRQAARVNSSKVPGPVIRALLPAIMKRVANSKRATEPYRHHIDWDSAIPAVVDA
jgi:2-polyprenyl-6-methoxyphenol hydroxylase-like FAD-dependent oxidoreductase